MDLPVLFLYLHANRVSREECGGDGKREIEFCAGGGEEERDGDEEGGRGGEV
jgi:hypothetical protein